MEAHSLALALEAENNIQISGLALCGYCVLPGAPEPFWATTEALAEWKSPSLGTGSPQCAVAPVGRLFFFLSKINLKYFASLVNNAETLWSCVKVRFRTL